MSKSSSYGRSGGSDGRSDSRYEGSVRDGFGSNFAGGMTECVTAVERRATSGYSVVSGKMTKDLERVGTGGELKDSSLFLYKSKINIEEKLVVEEAEEKLDKLEGVLVEDKDDVCLMFEEEEDIESKVHDTLARHAEFWRESGANEFAISVVENGYVP